MNNNNFILASASPRRLELLKQIGFAPKQQFSSDIDETPHKAEQPIMYAQRMAIEKAICAQNTFPNDIIVSADTVVCVGRRILPKAETEAQARDCLKLLSGRSHRVYTAIVVATPNKLHKRVVDSRLKFKRLSAQELELYIASNEWHGKAGGYAIQGLAAQFCEHISGSYSAVVGLPLYETAQLLNTVVQQ